MRTLTCLYVMSAISALVFTGAWMSGSREGMEYFSVAWIVFTIHISSHEIQYEIRNQVR